MSDLRAPGDDLPDVSPTPWGSGSGTPHELRALVVEDGTGDRADLVRILRERGFDVAVCQGAEAAWSRLRPGPPSLVLLDLALPGMAAMDLCRKIRAHPEGPGCVILALADDTDERALAWITAAGADDLLLAPLDPRRLEARLLVAQRRLVERRKRLATRRKADALARMGEISLAATSLSAALEGMLAEVVRVLDVPVGVVEHLEADGTVLAVAATHGVPFPAGPEVEANLHEALGGRAVREERPLVLTDPEEIAAHAPSWLRDREITLLASFPLDPPTARGALTLAAGDAAGTPDEAWLRLAAGLASGLATHVGRMEAEEALRANEARQAALVEELRQANEELESFAYSISHDLRAPLRTMQGFAHALLREFGPDLPDRARDFARRIIASGRESEVLINDLLAYSRLSFEDTERVPVELDAVVDAALEQVRADLDASGARVEVAGPLPTVPGSRTLLVQILGNLLSNAVKFVPDSRTPEVRVRAEEGGRAVRVWVEDNGVGIPPGMEERIFQVFERLEQGDERPGTGIGLAIVRRGIQRMGGSCGVEPRRDGAAFWIRLPRERRERPRSWSRRR